jgi:polyhydroxyalkanoate synthesis regulator phasin
MKIELNHTKKLLASCEQALENRDKKAERMYSEEEVTEKLSIVDIYARLHVLQQQLKQLENENSTTNP